MKKISILAAILLLASCGHNPTTDTNPAFDRSPSGTRTQEVMSCGLLGSSETARNAVDVNAEERIDDRLYSLQIDCNNDQVVDLEKEKLIVGVPMNQVTPSQKGWITRWRKIAIKNQKNQSARPYLCMKYSAWYNPCTEGKNAYGVSPKFSGKINFGKKVK